MIDNVIADLIERTYSAKQQEERAELVRTRRSTTAPPPTSAFDNSTVKKAKAHAPVTILVADSDSEESDDVNDGENTAAGIKRPAEATDSEVNHGADVDSPSSKSPRVEVEIALESESEELL